MPTRTYDLKKDVLNSVYLPYLIEQTRTQIFFGGSSSGKSKFLAQRTVFDLMCQNRNYLVIRNVGDTNRVSTFNEVQKVITEWNLSDIFTVNQSNMEITCATGYQAIFKGLDKVDKIKSITPLKGVITDIWVEEATETSHDAIKQLSKRLRGKSGVTKRLTLSFNPILRLHWIFKEYFSDFADGATKFHSEKLLILKKRCYFNK